MRPTIMQRLSRPTLVGSLWVITGIPPQIVNWMTSTRSFVLDISETRCSATSFTIPWAADDVSGLLRWRLVRRLSRGWWRSFLAVASAATCLFLSGSTRQNRDSKSHDFPQRKWGIYFSPLSCHSHYLSLSSIFCFRFLFLSFYLSTFPSFLHICFPNVHSIGNGKKFFPC